MKRTRKDNPLASLQPAKLPTHNGEPSTLPVRGVEGQQAVYDLPLEDLCRALTLPAVRALEAVIRDDTGASKPHHKIAAANSILDRGWGKPKDRVEIDKHTSIGEMSTVDLERVIARLERQTTQSTQTRETTQNVQNVQSSEVVGPSKVSRIIDECIES